MSISKAELLRVLKATRRTADTRYGVTVEKLVTATAGYGSSYVVKQNGVQVGATIDIPKDFLVKSGVCLTVLAVDKEENGKFYNNSNYDIGDQYLDFVVNTVDNDAADQHIYINVKTLIDVYQAGNGIELNPSTKTFSIKINPLNAHGLSVDSNGLGLALSTPDTITFVAATGTFTTSIAYYSDTLGTPADVSGKSVGDSVEGLYVTQTTPGTAGAMSGTDKTWLDLLASTYNETISDEEIAAIFTNES